MSEKQKTCDITYERIRELTIKILDALKRAMQPVIDAIMKYWRLYIRLQSNNFRKHHGLPMRRKIPKKYRR